MAWGVSKLMTLQEENRQLQGLSEKTELPVATEGEAPAHDWSKLEAEVPEVAAWLTVGNTDIDYPVMQPADSRPEEFFLHHDPWGNPSDTGTPYLQPGSGADGPHSLVLGHHLAANGQMFTPLAKTYRQEEFEGIGNLTWERPGGTVTLHPVCALSVDASYPDIQRYQFKDTGDLRGWLRGICEQASAKSSDWEARASSASRVVTLVTCSSDLAGQPERTLTVFCV